MTYATVLVDDLGEGIRRITLNRPEKRNPLSPKCIREVVDAVTSAASDPACVVVIIRGAGKAFSSGYGVTPEDLEPGDYPDGEPTIQDDVEAMRDLGVQWGRIWNARIPVIAQVHGYCLAGGTDLALHCDLVVTATDAQIGFPPVRSMGVPPTHMWLYNVGPQWAKRLLLTGDRISGETAQRIGLAVAAVLPEELDEHTVALARRIARVDRDLLAANKAVVNRGLELMGRTVLQDISATHDAIGHLAASARQFSAVATENGLRSAVEQRDAPFKQLGDEPL